MQTAAQTLTLESGSAVNSGVVKRSGNVVTTFAGISDAKNVRILGSDLDDQIDIAGNETLSGLMVNGSNTATQFGQVTLFVPAGGLRVSPSRGNDTVTIHSSAVIGQNPSPGPITIGDDVGNADRLILAVDLTTQQKSISIDMDTVDTEKGVGTVTVNGVQIAFEGVEDPENLVITAQGLAYPVMGNLPSIEEVTLENATAGFFKVSNRARAVSGDVVENFDAVSFGALSGSLTIEGTSLIVLDAINFKTPLTVRNVGELNQGRITFGDYYKTHNVTGFQELLLDGSFGQSVVYGTATIEKLVFTGTDVADDMKVYRFEDKLRIDRVLRSGSDQRIANSRGQG